MKPKTQRTAAKRRRKAPNHAGTKANVSAKRRLKRRKALRAGRIG